MTKVFVSGCYDIIHAGHVQFFKDARALGDELIVCFASDEVLMLAKNRAPAIPQDNKMVILSSFPFIDRVYTSSDLDPVFDFKSHILNERATILAVTEDDSKKEIKQKFCEEHGIKFVVLPKKPGAEKQVSTTQIRANIRNIIEVPLRIDFAGGWLDVPKFSQPGSFVVNCTITPKVSLSNWPYEKGAGLGGSGAHSILQVRGGITSELHMGVGWQDPAIIIETGLCVWRSGHMPVLEAKYNPDWLNGRLLILWRDKQHTATDYVETKRDFDAIARAGATAAAAVHHRDFAGLSSAVNQSYQVQLGEGMDPLPEIPNESAKKYLGAGHGGYALYMFETQQDRDAALAVYPGAKAIEPYIKSGKELLSY